MSLSDLRYIAFVAFVGLSACGYQPALAPGGEAETLRGSIAIADPIDAEGFALVRQLEVRLGRTDAAAYLLNADIRVRDEGVGILPDQTITRFQVVGVVDYRLTSRATDEQVTSGRVSNFTSYSATSTGTATTSAQRDARERLMISLADQITEELLLSQADWSE